jgi:hypothetical protein
VLAAMDSHKPRTLERNRFMEAPWQRAALACGLTSVAAIMPQAPRSGKPRQGRATSHIPQSGRCEPGRNMLNLEHVEIEEIRFEGQENGWVCDWPRQLRQNQRR